MRYRECQQDESGKGEAHVRIVTRRSWEEWLHSRAVGVQSLPFVTSQHGGYYQGGSHIGGMPLGSGVTMGGEVVLSSHDIRRRGGGRVRGGTMVGTGRVASAVRRAL